MASSRIEEVQAHADQVAAASLGVRTPTGARQVAAAARAARLLLAAADDHVLTLEDLLAAHRELMGEEAVGSVGSWDQVGRLRTVQNWIGGSDYSPRGALHVPPSPDRVPACMDDLLGLAARTDLPALAQAALVHAQLESIHPFVDGNGRIGRALIHAVLRRRAGIRPASPALVPVPVAAALAGRRQTYFAALDSYRHGDADQIVLLLADAVQRAVLASERAADRLEALPRQWRQVRAPRAGSAEAALLGALLDHPVLDAEDAREVSGASVSATYAALDSLTSAGVLRLAVQRRRDRVWVAAAVMDEVETLLDELAAPER
ncbi:Fic family protein [Actinomyces sp. 2119]|nr:Fic family protein [Actinomyces sp. 2119]